MYIKFHQWADDRSKYADGLYNSIIDNEDCWRPSRLIMDICTALRHALREWQNNEGVPPKASMSKVEADGPHRSNSFNYKNDGGKNPSCCTAMGRKLLSTPGVADKYTLLMNSWNTLPESYQQRVYNNTLATVKRQIQQPDNTQPAKVISTEVARVDNAILSEYLTSGVALEEPVLGCTDPNIPIDNNCVDDKLHFVMRGGSDGNHNEGDDIDESDAIPTTSR